ncbi:MAG: signal peptidase I [Parabacteroides sp.]|nr:signal peptidase I [Parabacteroides sp.]
MVHDIRIVKVKGNSMIPQFADGDVVLVEKKDTYNVGDVIVFWFRDCMWVLHRIISIDEGTVTCRGDNAKSESIIEVIEAKDILGKVVRKCETKVL